MVHNVENKEAEWLDGALSMFYSLRISWRVHFEWRWQKVYEYLENILSA